MIVVCLIVVCDGEVKHCESVIELASYLLHHLESHIVVYDSGVFDSGV